MDVMLVLAHPNERSLNHALAEAVRDALTADGHRVWFHDLYAEGFDPVLPSAELESGCELEGAMRQHCEQLANADGLVVVHPNWWGQPPAMMKGWVDRTFRPGIAYRFEQRAPGVRVPVGILKAERALVMNTSDTPQSREWGGLGDPLEALWRNTMLGMCGVPNVHHLLFAPVTTSTAEQQEAWLDEARTIALDLFAVVTRPS
ncbi:MAG: NAD(P)H-dependent oxidoreductase [Coriobacteriia bacterium]|nr:NAD(P)H-dependent oxidoreductase [Coriobacteriia bacterium]